MPRIHPEPPDAGAPALPRRTPPDRRARAAATRLPGPITCHDIDVLERVAHSLRQFGTGRGYQTRTQHEIDGVIARYRAAHPEARHGR